MVLMQMDCVPQGLAARIQHGTVIIYRRILFSFLCHQPLRGRKPAFRTGYCNQPDSFSRTLDGARRVTIKIQHSLPLPVRRFQKPIYRTLRAASGVGLYREPARTGFPVLLYAARVERHSNGKDKRDTIPNCLRKHTKPTVSHHWAGRRSLPLLPLSSRSGDIRNGHNRRSRPILQGPPPCSGED